MDRGTASQSAAALRSFAAGPSAAALRSFAAMGTRCEVTVYAATEAGAAAEALADLAVRRIALLEDCWSRFRPTSELSLLNGRAGTGSVRVSEDLGRLVQAMAWAWERTDGRCDPTVLSAVRANGYDADFAEVLARRGPASLDWSAPRPTPGMASVEVDGDLVRLPVGVGLDPGSIGKGLAADIVIEELTAAGALGAMVNLGGDLRFAGTPGADPQWVIGVVDERLQVDAPDRTLRWVSFDPGTSGAVATSTTLRRRWPAGAAGTVRHHIIDPATGAAADIDLVQATVIADEGWWAEAAATAALLLGPQAAPAWLDARELTYVLLDHDQVIEPPIGADHG